MRKNKAKPAAIVLRVVVLSAVLTLAGSSAKAQLVGQIGQACTGDATVATIQSAIQSQGIIQCIPDSLGKYFWQAEGAGIARYDNTPSCSIAGTVRWNGNGMQYCNGAGWQGLGGGFPPSKSAIASIYINPQITAVQCEGVTDGAGNVTLAMRYYDSSDGQWHATAGPSQTHLLSGSVYSGPNNANSQNGLQGFTASSSPGFGWYCMADITGVSETFWFNSSYYGNGQGNTAVFAIWQ